MVVGKPTPSIPLTLHRGYNGRTSIDVRNGDGGVSAQFLTGSQALAWEPWSRKLLLPVESGSGASEIEFPSRSLGTRQSKFSSRSKPRWNRGFTGQFLSIADVDLVLGKPTPSIPLTLHRSYNGLTSIDLRNRDSGVYVRRGWLSLNWAGESFADRSFGEP